MAISNGCIGTTSSPVAIIVDPLPVIDIGPDTTICDTGAFSLDAGNGFVSYLWSDGSTGQSLVINDSGSYWVKVVDINNCENTDTAKVTLVACTGINNKTQNEKIEVYPNPNQGIFMLSVTEYYLTGTLFIYDVLGKNILESEIQNLQIEIDLTSQPKGIYMIKVMNNDHVWVEKIVYE